MASCCKLTPVLFGISISWYWSSVGQRGIAKDATIQVWFCLNDSWSYKCRSRDMWEEWRREKAFNAETFGCGDNITHAEMLFPIKPFSPSHSFLPWFRPSLTSVRGEPVTSKKPLQATTHCIWKRAQRWINISKLNAPTTELDNVRPLIFLHRGDHKTLLIRDGFRSKWNFIKEWLERLSHKPGQLGASLLNLRTAETMNGHSADASIEAQTMNHLSQLVHWNSIEAMV